MGSFMSDYMNNTSSEVIRKDSIISNNSKVKEDKIYKSIEVLNQLIKSHFPYLTEILTLHVDNKHMEDFIDSKSDSLIIGVLVYDISDIEKSLQGFCNDGSRMNQSFNIPLRVFYTYKGNIIFIKLKYDENLYAKPED